MRLLQRKKLARIEPRARDCFLACNNDKSCEAVTMKWVAAGDVECFKRGGLTLKDCEPTPPDADDIYSTYTKD